MLLVMDVGNTHIVFGIYRDDELIHHWRIHTDRNATEDEYAMLLKSLFAHVGVRMEEIDGVSISSVVPPLKRVLQLFVRKYFGLEPLMVGPGVKTGLNIQYENPRDVGADRIVNAVAALQSYGPPLIIVDFGTATTFCFINEQGVYVGGAIVPGVYVSAEALHQRAAKLTRVEVVKPESVVGRNTVKAVQSGLFYGYVGVVDGIVNRMKELLTRRPTVVATGGLADLISKEAETIEVYDPLLTLRGLKIIYDRNQ